MPVRISRSINKTEYDPNKKGKIQNAQAEEEVPSFTNIIRR